MIRQIVALIIGVIALAMCLTGVGIPFAMALVAISYGISECKRA